MLEVLHHSGGVLAIAKPAGLPTQAVAGVESVEGLIRRQLFGDSYTAAVAAGRTRHPGGFLGVPHRLDRPVSGLLLLATSPRAARQLSRQFERRLIDKTYLAVVHAVGDARPAVGELFAWRDAIRKVPDEARAEIVTPGTPTAREAVTDGHVLAARGAWLLVQLHPRTGRTHQLRLQAAARGLLMLGDRLYGEPTGDTAAAESSMALHAWSLRYRDPETDEPVTLICPVPALPLWHDWRAQLPVSLTKVP